MRWAVRRMMISRSLGGSTGLARAARPAAIQPVYVLSALANTP